MNWTETEVKTIEVKADMSLKNSWWKSSTTKKITSFHTFITYKAFIIFFYAWHCAELQKIANFFTGWGLWWQNQISSSRKILKKKKVNLKF